MKNDLPTNFHSPLSPETISRYLPQGRTSKIICLDSVDSTNNYLRKLAADGAESGTVVIAESQTAGRGRQGKSFSSSKGKGIYLSALLYPQETTPEQLASLGGMVASAVWGAVKNACGVSCGIKWVNDLTLGTKKLCGILPETSTAGARRYVIIGIGVNVNHTEEDFPPELSDVATSLRIHTGRPHDRNRLAAEIIGSLDKLAADLPYNCRSYLDTFKKNCVTLGKQVRLISPAGESDAYAVGISDDFSLIVRDNDGNEKSIRSGEVSVRGMYGYV